MTLTIYEDENATLHHACATAFNLGGHAQRSENRRQQETR